MLPGQTLGKLSHIHNVGGKGILTLIRVNVIQLQMLNVKVSTASTSSLSSILTRDRAPYASNSAFVTVAGSSTTYKAARQTPARAWQGHGLKLQCRRPFITRLKKLFHRDISTKLYSTPTQQAQHCSAQHNQFHAQKDVLCLWLENKPWHCQAG